MSANENVGTLLIPDISGFSEFVSGVELSHSQHIIAELLEIILDANILGFVVSEIEGDAVLFYRFGSPPSLLALQRQAEIFYLKFHEYLQQIKRDTICKCGACQNVGKLTLKIIAHYGEIALIKIKGRFKLIGKDVIVAHRFLKNDVPSAEYLLLSESLVQTSGEKMPVSLQKYCVTYRHLGDFVVYVHSLSYLRSQIPPPPEPHVSIRYPNPIVVAKKVDAPMEIVHALLFDFKKMRQWNPGLIKVEFDSNKPMRLGRSHTCVFEDSSAEITLAHVVEKKNEVIVTNRMKFAAPILHSTAVYHLQQKSGGTHLQFIFSYMPYTLVGWLLDKMVRPRLARMFEENCEGLKRVAEEMSPSFKSAQPLAS